MNGHIDRRTSKTKGTRYRVLVFVDRAHGGPRWETHGTYDHEGVANAKLVKVLDAYHEGAYRTPSRLTVGDVVDRWLTEHVAQLSPLSRKNYTWICERFIVPEFGDELAEALTPAAISAWLARLLREGRLDGRGGMSPKYVYQVRLVLRAAYAWSVGRGELARNPLDAVPAPTILRRPVEPPSVKGMQAAMEALKGTRYYAALALAAGTGMRRGEVLGLDWAHVDLARGLVRVRRQLIETSEGAAMATLKTGPARRDLYLPPFVAEVLQAERRRQQERAQLAGYAWSPSALVCQNHDGGPIPPDKFSRGFTATLARRGLPRFRFHDLRHAVATEMLEAGDRADVVQRQLGHASVAVTLAVYAHVRPGEGEKAAARYGQKWQPRAPEDEPEEVPAAATRTHSETKSAEVLDLAAARKRRRPA